jgi:hypothetical protein
VLALQRHAGNAAVAALIQGKARNPAADRRAPKGGPPAGPAEGVKQPGMTPDSVSAQLTAESEVPAAESPGATSPRRFLAVQRWGVDDVVGGLASVAGGVRDSVLQTLAGWARRMPGYELLCTVLGRDVVAGTPVPRSASAIIGGFLGLMPRGETLRQQLQESGAIDRAGAWFEVEVPKLGLTWDAIRGLFSRAWDALSATDLLDPSGAWDRISGIFGPPLTRLRDFAVGAVTKVAEFVFEGAMSMAGGLGSQVMGIIRRAGNVFNQILHDPIGFAGNLVAAVRGGLSAFSSNIGTHLRNGLIGWLTGSLGGVVRLPAQFDLRGILGMAMEFLGLTWQNIRGRIARVIGDRAIGLLERGAGIAADVMRNGLSAITGRIAQFTSGLVDTVLGGIREWVTNSVVGAAITRLISMFNPAGAVIQAILAVYNTVQFFIERAQQLGALANSVFDSIAAIASGSIGNAVTAVEGALGRAVPVVLGFLARLIGLGDVATPVRNVMTRVQGVIGSAVDRVVGWVAGLARRVGGALRGGTSPTRAGADRGQGGAGDLSAAVSAADSLLRARGATPQSVRRDLGALQSRHSLRSAELVPAAGGGAFHIHVQRSEADTEPVPLLSGTSRVGVLWRVNDRQVTVQFEEGEAVNIPSAASRDRMFELVGRALDSAGMDLDEARNFVSQIESSGLLSADRIVTLLHQFAHRGEGARNPVLFYRKRMGEGAPTHAAFSGHPASSERRSYGIDQGVDEHGEQRRGPLSSIALVFRERQPGEWVSRAIQQQGPQRVLVGGDPQDVPTVKEYVWQGEGEPRAETLGTIEVADDGTVVRVIDVARSVRGGREGFIQMMRAAGWPMRLEP